MFGLPSMASAGGMSATDPRIQPFIKQVREEMLAARVKGLMCNGLSEVAARQEVERSMPIDKSSYMLQAMVKYFESLGGGAFMGGQAMSAYSPFAAMLGLHAQQSQQFQQQQQAQISYPFAASTSSQNQALQQSIAEALASRKQSTPATSSGVAGVLAAAQANASKTRTSRFDSSTQITQVTQPSGATPFSSQASSAYVPQMFNFQAQTTTPPTPAFLEKQLQQWKYQVYSSHQAVPRGMQGKQWRSILHQYVQKRELELRDSKLAVSPGCLLTMWIPNVAEVLAETGTSDSPYTQQASSSVPPPPSFLPPEPTNSATKTSECIVVGSLSPVSSSDDSSRESKVKMRSTNKGKRRRPHSRSSSRSLMSKSSTSCSPVAARRNRRFGHKRSRLFVAGDGVEHLPVTVGQKRARLSVLDGVSMSDEYIPLITGKKKKTKAERKAARASETAEEKRKKNERSRRFGLVNEMASASAIESEASSVLTTSEGLRLMTWQEKLAMLSSIERVVGQSQLLEKPYLRLCGPPDPALVRPDYVLVKSLKHCLDKWEKEKNYRFIEEQFRSIRQDMTVQGIRNDFAVEVYETNARVALENSDLGQFNQCQTQLRELHRTLNIPLKSSHREEFLCYRLLYLSLMNMRHDLLKLSGELTFEEKQLPGVKFADAFRRALIEGNFHRALQLSAKGPFLSSILIKIFINRLRMMYLVLLAKTHYTVKIEFLQGELLFHTLAECRKFLNDSKAVWTDAQRQNLDCRKSCSSFEASPLLQARKIQALG